MELGTLIFLARNDDGDAVKYVFGAIVVFAWIVGAIASAVNKKAKEAQAARGRYNPRPANVGNFPPPVPAHAGRGNPKQKQRARQQKRQAVAVVAPPQPVAQPVAAYEHQAPAETGAARNRRAAAAAAPANQIGRLLRRRETVRAAFILNEVIAPPLSLRDRRDRGGAASDARSA